MQLFASLMPQDSVAAKALASYVSEQVQFSKWFGMMQEIQVQVQVQVLLF